MSRICCHIAQRCPDNDGEFIGSMETLLVSQNKIIQWLDDLAAVPGSDSRGIGYARLHYLLSWAQIACQGVADGAPVDGQVTEDQETGLAKQEIVKSLVAEYSRMILASTEKTYVLID